MAQELVSSSVLRSCIQFLDLFLWQLTKLLLKKLLVNLINTYCGVFKFQRVEREYLPYRHSLTALFRNELIWRPQSESLAIDTAAVLVPF